MSLDGRKEIHDKWRVDYAGNGSFDRVVPKFQELVRRRGNKNYYMRGTFTHSNPDFLKDIDAMLALGFTELSMEPVVCAPLDPSALTEEDKPIVMKQYELLAEEMLERKRQGKPFTFYHYMIDLTGGPCIYKRISGCGSGTEYMAVTPWGDLYPCHQFVGEENSCSVIFGTALPTQKSRTSSEAAMYMREKSVPIAGLSSGAPADVRQTHIMPRVKSRAYMTTAVTSSAKE